jgi:hypothetical protein
VADLECQASLFKGVEALRRASATLFTMTAVKHTEPIAVAEIKAIAKAKLEDRVWDYYITGADEQKTVKRNETVFDEYVLVVPTLSDYLVGLQCYLVSLSDLLSFETFPK